MSACLLIYDIPQNAEVANPSGELRGIAVRINLSCWVIMESDIPYHLLHHLAENGATWHTLRFDSRDATKYTKIAQDAIKTEIRASLARVERSCNRATQRMQESREPIGEAVSEHRKKVLNSIKKLRKQLKQLQSAASRFGLDSEAINLSQAYSRVSTIRSTMHERAKAYVEAANALAEEVSPGDGVLQSARANLCPPGVLADYLEDKGRPEKTQKLRVLTNGGFWFA